MRFFTHVDYSEQSHESLTPILLRRQLKLREIGLSAQDHTASWSAVELMVYTQAEPETHVLLLYLPPPSQTYIPQGKECGQEEVGTPAGVMGRLPKGLGENR